jgi:chaperone modulatory protein CbpM
MSQEILTGIVIDERVELSVRDVCHACGSSVEWVVELVHEGVLPAKGDHTEEWRFSGATLSRAIRARRLQQELDLNLHGVALVLGLMDEIESLRRQLRGGP